MSKHDITFSICTEGDERVAEAVFRPERTLGMRGLGSGVVDARLFVIQTETTGRNENLGPCVFSIFVPQRL